MGLQDDAFRELERQLAALPDKKRGALIAKVDTKGVTFGVAAKLGDHWKLAADAEKQFDGPWTGEVLVAASW